jgi:hypothetical protein
VQPADRNLRLAEAAEAAAFLASNQAAAITGAFVNVTSGTSPASRSIPSRTWSPLPPGLIQDRARVPVARWGPGW